jgi:hypothetical protein
MAVGWDGGSDMSARSARRRRSVTQPAGADTARIQAPFKVARIASSRRVL